MALPSMSATRSCTTSAWWRSCAASAPASSTNSTRSRKAPSPSSVPMAYRRRWPIRRSYATCRLVAKVHREGQRYAEKGFDVILIGHEGHPEVEGTRGRIPGGVHLVQSITDVDKLKVRDPNRVAYITQTTLSVDDTRVIIGRLKERFPNVNGPDVRDICYATQNRQQAVRLLGRHVDIILVVGSSNSSNSNRLREIGTEMNVPSYLID